MTAVNFAVDLDRDGTAVTMRLTGELDIATVTRVREAYAEALEHAPTSLVIDLAGVEFIDSSGLKFLIEADRALRETLCELRIRRPPAAAMRVFTVTGADRHLPFTDAAEGSS